MQDNRVVFSAISSHSAFFFFFNKWVLCHRCLHYHILCCRNLSDHQGVVNLRCMGSHFLVCEGKQGWHVCQIVYSDLWWTLNTMRTAGWSLRIWDWDQPLILVLGWGRFNCSNLVTLDFRSSPTADQEVVSRTKSLLGYCGQSTRMQ